MMYYLFLFIFGYIYSSTKVEGLRIEKIIGGEETEENVMKFIAAITFKPQPLDVPNLIPCAGAIISNSHIATIAECFFHEETGEFIEREFLVIVSTVNLLGRIQPNRYFEVDLLIIPATYNPLTRDIYNKEGNIAIVKLSRNLGLSKGHRSLSKLRVPKRYNVVEHENCYVAGYGWSQFAYVPILEDDEPRLKTAYSNGKLHSAKIDLIDSDICERNYLGDKLARGNMCAKLTQEPNEHKGICEGDRGAPLVRRDYLLGLAIHGFPECNENKMPGIYIDVIFYNKFIHLVLDDKYPQDVMRVYRHERTVRNEFKFTPVVTV